MGKWRDATGEWACEALNSMNGEKMDTEWKNVKNVESRILYPYTVTFFTSIQAYFLIVIRIPCAFKYHHVP